MKTTGGPEWRLHSLQCNTQVFANTTYSALYFKKDFCLSFAAKFLSQKDKPSDEKDPSEQVMDKKDRIKQIPMYACTVYTHAWQTNTLTQSNCHKVTRCSLCKGLQNNQTLSNSIWNFQNIIKGASSKNSFCKWGILLLTVDFIILWRLRIGRFSNSLWHAAFHRSHSVLQCIQIHILHRRQNSL